MERITPWVCCRLCLIAIVWVGKMQKLEQVWSAVVFTVCAEPPELGWDLWKLTFLSGRTKTPLPCGRCLHIAVGSDLCRLTAANLSCLQEPMVGGGVEKKKPPDQSKSKCGVKQSAPRHAEGKKTSRA